MHLGLHHDRQPHRAGFSLCHSLYAKRARTVEASPVLKGNCALFGAMDGKFYAVNAATGQCEWRADLGSPVLASVAISGEMIYVADYGSNVYAFK